MSFKSIFRKIAAGFLAGVLTVGGLPLVGGIGETTVLAEEVIVHTSGDYKYELTYDGEIAIIGYLGTSKKVIIPSEIDGKKVTSISINSFQAKGITSVTIPNTVKSVYNFAFADNKLKSITIPDSVIRIDGYAFSGNTKLKKITVSAGNENYCAINGVLFSKDKKTLVYRPEGSKSKTYKIPTYVTEVSSYAFQNNALKSVTIPNSLTIIREYSFTYADLESVTIPNSVTHIGDSAFKNNKLTSVKIPNSVTTIGDYAFGYNYIPKTMKNTKVTGFTIKGKSGSYAERYYAKDNGFKFIAA